MHPHITNNKLAFASVLQDYTRSPPSGWNLEARNEDVMNGFLLYSLLLEKAERRGILVLPHDEASHKDRLQPALAERNKAMEGIGQEAYPHACDLCFFVFVAEDGTLSTLSIFNLILTDSQFLPSENSNGSLRRRYYRAQVLQSTRLQSRFTIQPSPFLPRPPTSETEMCRH